MRKSFQISCPSSDTLISPEVALGKALASKWLMRLLDLPIPLNNYFFSCLRWCADDLRDFVVMLQDQMVAYSGRSHNNTKLRHAIKEMQTKPVKRLDDALEELAEDHAWFQPHLRQCAQTFLSSIYPHEQICKPYTKSQKKIQTFFGLSNEAMSLCILAFLTGNFRFVEIYFEDTLRIQSVESRLTLSYMLNIPSTVCKETIAQLQDMGILYAGGSGIRLCEKFETIWQRCDTASLHKIFCTPLRGKSLPLNEFNIAEESKKHVMRLLRRQSSRPVHILLYGAPGTGKSSFAHALANELNVKAWAVPCKEDDLTQDRRIALTACLRMAAPHKNSFVLVDEAERLLDTSVTMYRSSSTKAWLNEFMEHPNQHVIWITNDVNQIDQAVRRRFSFSIHFEALDKIERRRIWLRTMQRLQVEKHIAPEVVEQFSDQYPTQVAVIEHALREAKTLATRNGFAACVERILLAHATLAENGIKPKRKPTSDTCNAYSLDGVCTVQPFGVQLDQLHRLNKHLNTNKTGCQGMGTILFYGPPGTGKTALAKHLAHLLGRNLTIRKASDLLDPYVGMTEKNIAAAFYEAQHNDTMLVIDEADSFLNNRDSVSQGWEKTQINEFLTALESFTGLCICTTNHRNGMDPAAMRRFSFKIEFTYAGPTQLEALYTKVLAPVVGTPLSLELKNKLCLQKKLTPGDFHAVLMQFWLCEQGSISHEVLLSALLHEQSLKLEDVAQRIGFA